MVLGPRAQLQLSFNRGFKLLLSFSSHSEIYEPYVGPDGLTLQKGRLIGHGSKWKKCKSNVIPFVAVDHPKAREIGMAVLEISEDRCTAKYMELAGEAPNLTLIENYREFL